MNKTIVIIPSYFKKEDVAKLVQECGKAVHVITFIPEPVQQRTEMFYTYIRHFNIPEDPEEVLPKREPFWKSLPKYRKRKYR